MPLYTYQCPACQTKQPIFKKIAELNSREDCAKCPEVEMFRVIEAPIVRGDYPGYDCPITGEWIEGRRAHQENLKRHGCRVLEPGESREAGSFRAQREEALENAIAETAAQIVETLPARKREQLVAELDNGLDVSFERRSA